MELESLSDYHSLIVPFAIKLAASIVVLLVGLWVIKRVVRLFRKQITSKFNESLVRFLTTMVSVCLRVLLIMSIAQLIGIGTASFLAVLGSAGLALGLALSGLLQNFAGGVVILILKPFQKGDYIEAQGYAGTVQEIQIFSTYLLTPDNVSINIPNGPLSTGTLKNYSTMPTRRVDIVFGIGYDDDLKLAIEVLNDIIGRHPKILKDPAPFVRLGKLNDSSLDITTRSWVNKSDYWDVSFDLHEAVKKTFDAKGISFPYPQRTVHLVKES